MSTRKRRWPVPVALVALSAIPLAAGTLRLIQLAGGPPVIPADLVLGVAAVRREDVATHRAWMIDLAVAEWVLRRPARRSLAFATGPRRARALS